MAEVKDLYVIHATGLYANKCIYSALLANYYDKHSRDKPFLNNLRFRVPDVDRTNVVHGSRRRIPHSYTDNR